MPKPIVKHKKFALNILIQRRETCKKCKFFTKNNDPKFAKFGGLTNESKCKKVNKTIPHITIDPYFSCPIKRFGKVPV